jgi:hypothetical protein
MLRVYDQIKYPSKICNSKHYPTTLRVYECLAEQILKPTYLKDSKNLDLVVLPVAYP